MDRGLFLKCWNRLMIGHTVLLYMNYSILRVKHNVYMLKVKKFGGMSKDKSLANENTVNIFCFRNKNENAKYS